MKLVVGLGNPGEKFVSTRHNTGFMATDLLAKKLSVSWESDSKFNSLVARTGEILLVKPQTFMNSSGETVQKYVNFYKINESETWVIHDDLDIKLGQYKIQNGVGPKVHYGIQSIDKLLGTKNYWRVRIGVDHRGETRTSGEDYVLQKFDEEEREILGEIIEKATEEVLAKLKS